MTILIEAAVETLDAALAAVEGGAHRIELCADLANGGTTPDVWLLRTCRSQLAIPIFVLVRPRPGDFVYTQAEHEAMLEQIATMKKAGAHGIVTGALTREREIDQRRTRELLDATRPLPLTFHRAFDDSRDLGAALDQLIRLDVTRVLTSGGERNAIDGRHTIRRLVEQADGRIEMLAGGSVNADNVARLVEVSGVREVHFSVKDANKVRGVISVLKRLL
ncbi:MAG TPA: copper homeostasis protein CutC [Gemmatimonadales bacterium]|nr:copper homeostasis protein CutC [Gemmatimonadales bacterium]